MITLAISSLKGGRGKTTTAINLAYSVAKRGFKTLPSMPIRRAPSGCHFLPAPRATPDFSKFFNNGVPFEQALLKTKLETLGIVMSGKIPTNEISKWCTSLQDGQRLAPFFKSATDAGYDIVILDTPSGLHGPTEGILRSCSPRPRAPAVRNRSRSARSCLRSIFLNQLQTENEEACSLVGVVLTMADPHVEDTKKIVEEIKRVLPPELVFQAMLPRDSAVIHASMKGMPLGSPSRWRTARHCAGLRSTCSGT